MEISRGLPPPNPCKPCAKGKQTHADMSKASHNCAITVLSHVFSDICKVTTPSYQGYQYFVTWIDDKSRNVWVLGLHEKSEVTQHLKAFVAKAELETGTWVITFHMNGGGEYTGAQTQKFFEEKGIKHEITMPNTPQQNSVVECMNHTLLDKVQAMLINATLPETYWFDALKYAATIHNLLPIHALENMMPTEAWSGNKPNVSCLRVFGCHMFVHLPDKAWSKLSAKSLICTFLGNAHQHSSYRAIHRPSCHFLETHDVVFNEERADQHYHHIIEPT
jgi:transposase InsO family protein